MLPTGRQLPLWLLASPLMEGPVTALERGPVVIHFFPLSFSDGCQIQNRRFQRAYPDLVAMGAEVFGISTDAPEFQAAFSQMLGLPFPLISDQDGHVASAFGVLRDTETVRAHRALFVIGVDNWIIEAWQSPNDLEVFPDPALAKKALESRVSEWPTLKEV
ncbi:MAG: redoxin domain-containing protein [Actinobacteria bacterium]|nr:redoxin domain-containing protein [Actinomycetota bacterium]